MIYLMIVVGAIESTVEGCKSACMLYDVDELRLLRLLRLLRNAAHGCDRMGRRTRDQSFDINTEEIQPIDNILHMNTDPTKWRLPSEETK